MDSDSPAFYTYLRDVHQRYATSDDGKVADYIPELALAKPEWFGLCVITKGGQCCEVGDSRQLFSIQSIAKAFVYGLALEDCGREYVNSHVSVEPTGEAFNAIILDEVTNRPYNHYRCYDALSPNA